MEPIINNNIPKDVFEWLYKRGLTNDAISQAQLSWKDDEIVIPIFDEKGKLIFNKYRRNPFNNEGPKYRYEKGSTSALYNLHTISEKEDVPIFICEGELDCLLLNSLGLTAVTSTGGSGTFNKEWASYFDNKEVFIVFDRDEAGYKGAIKVQRIIPSAKIIFLGFDMEGNDVTDYFQNHNLKDFFALKAKTYPIPPEPSGTPATKKEMKQIVDSFSKAADELLEIKRETIATKGNVRPIEIMLEYTTSRYNTFKHLLQSFDRKFPKGEGDGKDVLRAKDFSITNIIAFNYDGFAKCIWHNEKSASMRYNPHGTKYPNTVKCFGCGAMGDPIDVVMQMQNLEFKDAVKFILNI